MFTPSELIHRWNAHDIQPNDLVTVRGAFFVGGLIDDKCWMPSKPVDRWRGRPPRETSVQVIGEVSDLVDGLFSFSVAFTSTEEDPGTDVFAYRLQDVVVEGTVSAPTVPGYPVALRDIRSLVVYDDMESEGLPSTLGRKENRRKYMLHLVDGGKLRIKWEDE